ncbi:MAG: hypothetical protein LBR25_00605 [Erysipelotrichaceae bacterium]|nr:hypothetical protein [Erysipelotrichaceae bacterium]
MDKTKQINTYRQFHGQLLISDIGKELRRIAKIERGTFKILTGYGASTGVSQSKQAALKSLANMKREGLIAGYLPGDIRNQALSISSPFYDTKSKYWPQIKTDPDYGNRGIIFVFVK